MFHDRLQCTTPRQVPERQTTARLQPREAECKTDINKRRSASMTRIQPRPSGVFQGEKSWAICSDRSRPPEHINQSTSRPDQVVSHLEPQMAFVSPKVHIRACCMSAAPAATQLTSPHLNLLLHLSATVDCTDQQLDWTMDCRPHCYIIESTHPRLVRCGYKVDMSPAFP